MMFIALKLYFLFVSSINALSTSLSPDTTTFLLQHLNNRLTIGNASNSRIYVHNACLYNTEQLATTRVGEQSYSLPLYPSIQSVYCSVVLKVVQHHVSMVRPFLDIIVYRDYSWVNIFKQKLCVTASVKNSNDQIVKGSCSFADGDRNLNACLIRLQIPVSWFKINSEKTPHWTESLETLYSVGTSCLNPQIPLDPQKVIISNKFGKMDSITLTSHETGQFVLITKPEMSFLYGEHVPLILSWNTISNNINSNLKGLNRSTSSKLKKIEIKLWIDSRLELTSTTLMDKENWSLKLTPAIPPTFHTSFVLTSSGNSSQLRSDNHLLAIMLRLKQSRDDSIFVPEFDYNKVTSLHWAVKIHFQDDDVTDTRSATKFLIGQDQVYSIAPISHGKELINSAVISGNQVSLPMRIFSVSLNGHLHDITEEAHCISSEPKLLKISPTCTSVFVDGSELRGHPGIKIHVQYLKLTSTTSFIIWYPQLPITVWVSDNTLNSINEWRVASLKKLPFTRHRREAKQLTCKNRYQQAEVKVFAAFHIVDLATGDQSYLSKDRDLMFDVTQLAINRVQSADPSVLTIKKKNEKLLVSPQRPGSTKIVVKGLPSFIDYGSVSVMVSDDRVSSTQLLVKPVINVDLKVIPEINNPVQYELTSTVQSEFSHQFQHGTAEIFIIYSDGQFEVLDNVDADEYTLNVYSSDDHVLRINHKETTPAASLQMIALKGSSEATITVELHSPEFCEASKAPPISSGFALVALNFEANNLDSTLDNYVRDYFTAQNLTLAPDSNFHSNLQPVLIVLLALIFITAALHLVIGKRFYSGYGKLVAPFLSKRGASENSLCDNHDEAKEWVWLTKDKAESSDVASRYSQRSTLQKKSHDMSRESLYPSSEEFNHKAVSVSYRGSEISVFIGPEAGVTVNEDDSWPRQSVAYPNKEHRYSVPRMVQPEKMTNNHVQYSYSQERHRSKPYYQSMVSPEQSTYYDKSRTMTNPVYRPRIFPDGYNDKILKESIA